MKFLPAPDAKLTYLLSRGHKVFSVEPRGEKAAARRCGMTNSCEWQDDLIQAGIGRQQSPNTAMLDS